METCRICLEEDTKENMISPCKCKGTMKYVHEECLNKWRIRSERSYYMCNECKSFYNLKDGMYTRVFNAASVVFMYTLIALVTYVSVKSLKIKHSFFITLIIVSTIVYYTSDRNYSLVSPLFIISPEVYMTVITLLNLTDIVRRRSRIQRVRG